MSNKRKAPHPALRPRPEKQRSHKKREESSPRVPTPHHCAWKTFHTVQAARIKAMQQQKQRWSNSEKAAGKRDIPLGWVRTAVALLWHQWEKPPTDYWGGSNGFVSFIVTFLNLAPGARKMVKKVLHKAVAADKKGVLFEPARGGQRSSSTSAVATSR